jgi:hypothetical protein
LIFGIMVMAYFYYRALGNTQLATIGYIVFRRHRAAGAGVLRRPVLAVPPRGRLAGMVVSSGVDLHAIFAELPRRQHRRHAVAAAGSARHRGIASTACSAPICRRCCTACSGHRAQPATYIAAAGAGTSSIERLQADLFVPHPLALMTPTFRAGAPR